MSSDDNQVQNIYKYSRKTHKSKRITDSRPYNNVNPQDDTQDEDINLSPRGGVKTDAIPISVPGCSCSLDTEGEIANILHKKSPVIALAQQQLQRLLDETDKLFCNNTHCCRSICDFLHLCKEVLSTQNKCYYVLIILCATFLMLGVLLGAASCGTYLGRFNSPVLTCIDNLFIPDSYPKIENTFRSIV